MSLTLNISKEAKIFYKNERRIKECVEARIIQPTTTIHMKKHSPPNRLDEHPALFGHDDDQSSDDCLMEDDMRKRRRLEAWRKKPKRSPPSDPRTPRYSFKGINRHSYVSDSADNLDNFSKRQKREKREGVEKWTQGRIRETHHQKEKQKRLGEDKSEIPSRDLNGEDNDSDEMGEDARSDNMSIVNDISPAQDISHYDEDLRNIDRDENLNISENNPFARQRVLKSRYKNMYNT